MSVAVLHAGHVRGFDFFAVLGETALDYLRLLPFLFLACLLGEWLSRSSARARAVLARGGRLGPLLGALLGVIPQCGLSAAAARLYAARLLSLGTLLAVFLSTSDEMLPILLAGGISPLTVLSLVGVKLLFAAAVGFFVDAVFRRSAPSDPEALSFDDGTPCPCGCCTPSGKSGWVSLLFGVVRHTLSISLYLFLTMLAFALAVSVLGEERFAALLSSAGVLGVLLSALAGLIPNCAVSVVLSELWMVGAISTGALLAGLAVGAGVGLLILFRINRPLRDTLRILALLLVFGASLGILFDLTGLGGLFVP